MARIRYVNAASTTGGDGTTNDTAGANRAYATLAAALTAELGTSAMTEDVTFYITGAYVGGTPLGDTQWDAGWSTAGYTVTVEAHPDNRHAGVYDSAKARFDKNTTGSAMGARLDPGAGGKIIFKNLQLELSGASGTSADNILRTKSNSTSTGTVILDSCIIRQTGARSRALGMRFDLSNANATLVVANCIFSGFSEPIINVSGGGRLVHYNTLFIDNAYGVSVPSASNAIAYNCITQDEVTTGYRTSGGYGIDTSATNISEDATSPQTGLRSVVLDFVDKAGGNYALAAGDTEAIDAGTDLSADSIYPFDWDITGATRTGTWEIGPFNYSAPGLSITSVNAGNDVYSGQTLVKVVGTGLSNVTSATYKGAACTSISKSSSLSITMTFPDFFANNIKVGAQHALKVRG